MMTGTELAGASGTSVAGRLEVDAVGPISGRIASAEVVQTFRIDSAPW
jgi:hypothetical protein